MMSDLAMVIPTLELAESYSERRIPVYLYLFSHSSVSVEDAYLGSYHSSELNYLFGSTYTGVDVDGFSEAIHNYTEADYLISVKMMTWWSNFVKHGYI